MRSGRTHSCRGRAHVPRGDGLSGDGRGEAEGPSRVLDGNVWGGLVQTGLGEMSFKDCGTGDLQFL